jgi:hypothetical protein
MPFDYHIHETAYEEYIDAYSWYEIKSEGLGGRFMGCVEKRILFILENPEYYSKRHGNFREAKVEDFPYIIVYEFFKRKRFIHISAIYHIRRNPRHRYRKRKQ